MQLTPTGERIMSALDGASELAKSGTAVPGKLRQCAEGQSGAALWVALWM